MLYLLLLVQFSWTRGSLHLAPSTEFSLLACWLQCPDRSRHSSYEAVGNSPLSLPVFETNSVLSVLTVKTLSLLGIFGAKKAEARLIRAFQAAGRPLSLIMLTHLLVQLLDFASTLHLHPSNNSVVGRNPRAMWVKTRSCCGEAGCSVVQADGSYVVWSSGSQPPWSRQVGDGPLDSVRFASTWSADLHTLRMDQGFLHSHHSVLYISRKLG